MTGLKESLLAKFDHEMAMTRRVLERVPEDAFGWQPHEKSFTLGGLATHLAQLPHWGSQILAHSSYDLTSSTPNRVPKTTRIEVLETFDTHVAEVRHLILTREDPELKTTWTLKRGAHIVLTASRVTALETFLIHHVIHHRGQMTVYLRMRNVALPPLYGPTADEPL